MLISPDQESAFQECLRFLAGVEKRKGKNRSRGSYGLKHKVERPCDGVYNGYVYEGTFIVAALVSGFTRWQPRVGSISSWFNMTEGSLNRRCDDYKTEKALPKVLSITELMADPEMKEAREHIVINTRRQTCTLSYAYPYEIDLDRIKTERDLLGWSLHLMEKNWMTLVRLHEVVRAIAIAKRFNLHIS